MPRRCAGCRGRPSRMVVCRRCARKFGPGCPRICTPGHGHIADPCRPTCVHEDMVLVADRSIPAGRGVCRRCLNTASTSYSTGYGDRGYMELDADRAVWYNYDYLWLSSFDTHGWYMSAASWRGDYSFHSYDWSSDAVPLTNRTWSPVPTWQGWHKDFWP